MLPVVRHPHESLKAVSDLRERDRQWFEYPRGHRYHAFDYEFKLETTMDTTEYMGEEMTTIETDLTERRLLLSTHDLCLRRQRHHHVHGRRRHDNRHL